MSEFARSREVHKALRVVFDRELKPLGFRRCKLSSASYFREIGDTSSFTRFWTQISQFGDNWSGNSFTISFDSPIADPHELGSGANRLFSSLPDSELERAEHISERIITRMPRPPKGHWIHEEMKAGADQEKFWKRAFENAFRYQRGRFVKSGDIWFNYFSVDDVTDWAEFLVEHIPAFAASLDHQAEGAVSNP